MSSNNKNTNTSQHTFYKEAKKSWLQNDGSFDWKKLKKRSVKTLKWALGGYLAVTAVWGCVQGFIIKTSSQPGQGLEVYMTHNDVLPNYYKATENVVYQVSTTSTQLTTEDEENNLNGSRDENGLINDNGLAPLPFLMENPEYGMIVVTEDNYDEDNPLHIEAQDWNFDGDINQADVDAYNTYWGLNNGEANDVSYIRPAEFNYLMGNYSVSSYAYQATFQDTYFLSQYLTVYGTATSNINVDGGTSDDDGYLVAPTSNQHMLFYDFEDNVKAAVPAYRTLETDNNFNEDQNGDGDEVWAWTPKTTSDTHGQASAIQSYDADNDGEIETGEYRYNPTKRVAMVNEGSNTSDQLDDTYVTYDITVLSEEALLMNDGTLETTQSNGTDGLYVTDNNVEYVLAVQQMIFGTNAYNFVSGTAGTAIGLDDVNVINPDTDASTNLLAIENEMYSSLTNLSAQEQATVDYWHGVATGFQTNLQAVNMTANSAVYTDAGATTGDRTSATDITTPAATYGMSLYVMPVTEIFVPTRDAVADAQEARNVDGSSDYQYLHGYGWDGKIANAGWMLLGDPIAEEDNPQDVNQYETYSFYHDDNGDGTIDSNDASTTEEKNYGKVVARQKTVDEGEVRATETGFIIGTDTLVNDQYLDENVLEYKIDQLATGGSNDPTQGDYLGLMDNVTLTIGDTKYEMQDMYLDFVGLSTGYEIGTLLGQSSRYVTPDQQMGVTTYTTEDVGFAADSLYGQQVNTEDGNQQTLTYVGNDDENINGELDKNNTIDSNGDGKADSSEEDWLDQQESSIDESLRAAGYDPDNSGRYSMVTWGEAWAWGGPYYGTFVWPLSKLSIWVNSWLPYEVMGGWGVILGVFLIVFMLRGVAALMSFKRNESTQKMQELQVQVANIKAKYEPYKDNKQMKQRMQMEIQALYRKHNVNPFQSLMTMLITLPVFLAMWTIISAIPIYKIASIGAFSFAVSPMSGMFNTGGGVGWIYLLFVITLSFTQWVSTKLPTYLANKRRGVKNMDEKTKAQVKKQNRTTTIMLVVFIILGLTIPTLLGIYWISSSLFTISQTLFQHNRIEAKEKKKHAVK